MFALTLTEPPLRIAAKPAPAIDLYALQVIALWWVCRHYDYVLLDTLVTRPLWLAFWRPALDNLYANHSRLQGYERMVERLGLDYALEWANGWRLEYPDFEEGKFDVPRYRLVRHGVEWEYWQTRSEKSLALVQADVARALWLLGLGQGATVYMYEVEQMALWEVG